MNTNAKNHQQNTPRPNLGTYNKDYTHTCESNPAR